MRAIKKSIIVIIAALMLFQFAIPVYAQGTATVNVPVKSSYTGAKAREIVASTYILKADDESYPMPKDSVDGQKSISIMGNNEDYFGKIEYTRAGIYSYTVYQEIGESENCIYDNMVYKLTVPVINSEGGGLQAIPYFTRSNSEYKWARAEFVNQYYSHDGGLSVVKSANRGTAKGGEEIVYSIIVSNNGATDLQGVRVRDYVPAYTFFKRVNDKYGEFGSINDRDHVTWFIPELKAGEKLNLSFTVLVDDCITENISIKNTALYEVTDDPTPIPTNDPDNPENLTNGVDIPPPVGTPKTGENSNLQIYVTFVLISGVSIVILLLCKKKTKQQAEFGGNK